MSQMAIPEPPKLEEPLFTNRRVEERTQHDAIRSPPGVPHELRVRGDRTRQDPLGNFKPEPGSILQME